MTVVALERVSVSFPIYGLSNRSLKKRLLKAGTQARIAPDSHERITVRALRDVSLEIQEGDWVGIVGVNGAGKSTLLRTIAGIYEPASGACRVAGSVTTLFSINLGIDQEATGYENIVLRGRAAGRRKADIEQRAGEIAEFTELGAHLNLPVHTYSAGMRARLAFAISTAVNPDILLMDEWLGAGDQGFIDKARARIQAMVDDARVLVLASHNKRLLQRVCDKAIFLDGGTLKAFGPIDEVMAAYEGHGR